MSIRKIIFILFFILNPLLADAAGFDFMGMAEAYQRGQRDRQEQDINEQRIMLMEAEAENIRLKNELLRRQLREQENAESQRAVLPPPPPPPSPVPPGMKRQKYDPKLKQWVDFD